MRVVAVSILFLMLSSGLAQETYKIRISYKSSVSSEKFEIEYLKRDNKATIYLAEFDSLNSQWSLKDRQLYTEIEKRFKSLRPKKDDYRVLPLLFRKYEVYNRDSLTISLEDPLNTLADALVKASDAVLKGKRRVGLDGAIVRVDIFSHDVLRTVTAWSPTATSHPLIHGLMQGILDRYRGGNPKILKKELSQAGILLYSTDPRQ